ncbi:MAG: tetratricopeptide repeat protein [Thermoanaerobaculaceae bacterium]|nr:tetratricopeptide repeat protein [Thermoanaerobaculaceae bacterium]
MKRALPLVLLAVLGTGCSTGTVSLTYLTADRWEQEVRKRGVDPSRVPNPLAYSEPMRATATRLAGDIGNDLLRLRLLQVRLFDEAEFPFRYSNRETLTAAEAFFRREGNCLSFTNLFVSLARSIQLPVTTALVKRTRASEREGDLIVVNNHVVATFDWNTKAEFFDFDQRRHEPPTQFKPLDDLWITALYLNNKGADELRTGHPDIAIRYFEDAVKLAPDFAASWGNLGVARRRLGDINGGLQAYEKALAIESDNPTILNNLSSLYRALGRHQEADNALTAANMTLASPHVLIVRGDLELTQGRPDRAERLYKRAHKVGPKLADPLIALARLEYGRSNTRKALSYVGKALEREPRNRDAQDLDHRLRGLSSTN